MLAIISIYEGHTNIILRYLQFFDTIQNGKFEIYSYVNGNLHFITDLAKNVKSTKNNKDFAKTWEGDLLLCKTL